MSTVNKRKRMTIADFKNKGLGDKLRKKTEAKNDSPPTISTIPSVGFSSEYAENILRIKNSHVKMCRQLKIQSRTRCHIFNYLNDNNYFITSYQTKQNVNMDGKRLKLKKEAPDYPLRMTFFNGGKCHFPYSAWKDVFIARSKDIQMGNLLYDNDFARSNEGIRLFFELDYRSKDDEPKDETILEHVLSLQRMVKTFYSNNSNVDYSMWVLLSTSKPKYIATEVHPIIATGCHVVFRNIVVNCEQGLQLCHSANLMLETLHGVKELVDCCYKREVASLRPIYCRKLEECMVCLNDDDMRLSCEDCLCRGKIPSGSIYTISRIIDSNGLDIYDKQSDLYGFVKNNMIQVVSETSIIPPKINMFTKGYELPVGEPKYIPVGLRSIHKDDESKDFVYRKDRKVISLRRKDRFKKVVDVEIIRLISGAIRTFHTQYNNDRMLISDVSRNSDTFFVDLKGVGRSFCRVKCPEGETHQSNRVYFRLSKRYRTITQYCYDDECKQLLTDASVKARVTSNLSGFLFNRIFTVLGKECSENTLKPITKHDSMNDFLKSFGT